MRKFHIIFKQAIFNQIIYHITLADKSAKSCNLFLFYEYVNFLGKKLSKFKYQH